MTMNESFVVNARCLTRRTGGVERYARAVTKRLGERVWLAAPTGRWQGSWGHAWEQVALPRLLTETEALWSPANSGPLRVSKQAVTIHDVSVWDHPEWYRRDFAAWYRYLLPRLAQTAAVVITCSSYSYIRIKERLRICDRKIAVVPCGVDRAIFHSYSCEDQGKIRRKYRLPGVYLLAVGSPGPRKNLFRLLRAWEISGLGGEAGLVLVGANARTLRGGLGPIELPGGVRSLGYVSDADLARLYSGAAAYVLPSLQEGFGLTVLEAMACGAPVIASRSAALPEVVGNAGLLIDPLNEAELAWAMRTILEDSALRQALIARGTAKVCDYSWEQTAESIWTILERIR